MPNKNTKKQALFKNRSFLWMLSGSFLSMLGDQFTLIALPWLVLKMSNDSFTLGLVLALIGLPRAVFMLIGGAVVDRFSPKTVMMITKYINTVLLGGLALILYTDHLDIWMVYAIAFVLGVSTAFSIPSGTSMLPRVLAPEFLQAGNGIMLSLRQLTFFLGPVLAGVLIAFFGTESQLNSATSTLQTGNHIADAKGLAAAFFFDCLSYAISAWTLAKVQMRPIANQENGSHSSSSTSSIWGDIVQGLRHSWNDTMLRTCFMYWAAVAFFIMGPIQVAMPLLAEHVSNSASVFGMLAGAHGAGTLIGMVLSAVRPNMRVGNNLGSTILFIDFCVACLFMPMGFIHLAWQAAILLLLIGVLSGYLHVAVYTWIQGQVPPAMLGRTMSIFMFIFMGIGPVSAAITGWLMQSISIQQVFIGSAGLMIVLVTIALFMSPMRRMQDALRS